MSTEEKKTPAVAKQDISVAVLKKVEAFRASGELTLPSGYSPENALKSAYLILGDTKNSNGDCALDYCTKDSIANSLLKMVVWGLSPMKKQVDFVMYGNILKCEPEYTGNVVLAKRFGGLKEIKANTIFEGDNFVYEVDPKTGRKRIVKHEQSLESIDTKKVRGAYAVMQMNDGTTDLEVMNIDQIRKAWEQGGAKGNSPAHKNFTDQMANKTVINRACKLLIRTSDDTAIYTPGDDEDGNTPAAKEATVDHKVKTETAVEKKDFKNVEEVDFEEVKEPAAEEPKKEEPKTDGPGF